MDNKLLFRDLQIVIPKLKSSQLKKMLSFYEKQVARSVQKIFSSSNPKCFSCKITAGQFTQKGFGRTQQQALSNATKQFFSILITSEEGIQIIRNALKFKDEEQRIEKKLSAKKPLIEMNETMVLDDVSMICTRQQSENQNCQCMFFDLNKENERKIKHLEARINLLSEQNAMLKKLLLQDYDKENQSCYLNTSTPFDSN